MKLIPYLIAVAACCLAVACGGGGGDAGTPPFGPGSGTDGGGTTTPPPPTAADLTLVLSATQVANTGAETLTATATAVDANRNALAGIAVTLSVDSNATTVVSGTTTNDQGVVTGTVSIGSDKSNRIVTVTATSGSLSRTASFNVTGAKLQSTVTPAEFSPGEAGTVQYTLADSNSTRMPSIPISVTAPGGIVTEGQTDVNGQFLFTFTAPTTPGPIQLIAAAAGTSLVNDLIVNAGTPITPPADGIVESAKSAGSPSVVTVNNEITSNQSEMRALFVGASNKPIKNIRVRFDLNGDANSIGGSLAAGSNIVYSDDSGIARTSYVPGTRSGPTNGLTVRACWDYRDFAMTPPARIPSRQR